MKKLIALTVLMGISFSMFSQEGSLVDLNLRKDTLNLKINELKSKLGPLEKELKQTKSKIEILKGWQIGAFGTFGFNQSTFNNWIKGRNPNATSSSISAALGGFANKKTGRSFWRNAGNVNLGWLKLDIDTEEGEDSGFEKTADVLKLTSLYGRNFTKKLALSAQGEYNTAILSNLNNPGVLDLGFGFTWTPEDNLVLVLNPLNYHWVFGDSPEFENSLGMKITIDYRRKFLDKFTWRTNLTGFQPYQKQDPSLREYTWINGLSFTAWKGIGVGIEYAIRNADVEFDGMQRYFVLGLSYSL
jgi:hypothetical protein